MKQFFIKLHYIINYIHYVILPVIPFLIHELSHWIIAFLFWLVDRTNRFPVIKIDRVATMKLNSANDGYTINSWYMYVHVYCADWQTKVIRIAPIFSTIAIGYFAVINGVLTTLIFIYNLSDLYLSMSDTNGLFNNNQTKSNQ